MLLVLITLSNIDSSYTKYPTTNILMMSFKKLQFFHSMFCFFFLAKVPFLNEMVYEVKQNNMHVHDYLSLIYFLR